MVSMVVKHHIYLFTNNLTETEVEMCSIEFLAADEKTDSAGMSAGKEPGRVGGGGGVRPGGGGWRRVERGPDFQCPT